MGVKSTTKLTREEAEQKFIYFTQEMSKRSLKRGVKIYDDTKLEDILERMNNEVHDGEGFDNYRIVEENEK